MKVLFAALYDVHGTACWVRGRASRRLPVIVVNEMTTGERQRFTLAHEIGHIVMDVIGELRKAEKAANCFGGAFLMPAAMLWGRSGTEPEFGKLWGTLCT